MDMIKIRWIGNLRQKTKNCDMVSRQ